MFLTTHDMSTATELCDRVAFIVDGEIKLIDSPRNLMLARGRREVRLEYRMNGSVAGETFPLEGLGDNPEFLSILRTREIQTIHTEEATLERVFIEVTGRTLS
jgi:fluoroquinolone transport system ATP-binding protein